MLNNTINSKMRLVTFVIAFASFSVIFCEKVRFDSYRVYSIKIESIMQLKALQELENDQNGLTFMEAPLAIGIDAELIVPPDKFSDISEFFEKFDMKNEVKTNNLQRLARASFLNKNYEQNRILAS